MTRQTAHPDVQGILQAARRALVRTADGIDASDVHLETPLAALVFDSLMAINFIATLEEDLGVGDLPFERWLAEHSESTDALTVGSLVEWLRVEMEAAEPTAFRPDAKASRGRAEDG